MAQRRRVFRVAEKIRELVAGGLQYAADPRLRLVTVTGVVASPDLGEAKVYWNVAGGEAHRLEAERAFESAAGHFRHLLAKELGLRVTPRLKFFYDETLDTAEAVEKLLRRVNEEGSSE
jgi:ribosome-binding factor A